MSLSLGRDGWLQSVQQKCAGLRGRSVVRRGAEQAVGAGKASASRQDEGPGAARTKHHAPWSPSVLEACVTVNLKGEFFRILKSKEILFSKVEWIDSGEEKD